jgi:hypothetical protein
MHRCGLVDHYLSSGFGRGSREVTTVTTERNQSSQDKQVGWSVLWRLCCSLPWAVSSILPCEHVISQSFLDSKVAAR